MGKLMYLLIGFFFFGCNGSDDDNISSPDDPANLVVAVNNFNDGSGTVVFNVTADRAVSYEFNLGDNSNVILQPSGTLEYVYQEAGNYKAIIRAYGASGRYLRKEKIIRIGVGSNINLEIGYSTPESYPGMDLVWREEFNGNSLDNSKWSYDIGTGCPDLCGWGNQELEYYREQNGYVGDDVLTIEAKEQSFDGSNYTSAKLLTRDKFSYQYGRLDVRARLPRGQGIWPAIWLLGQNHAQVGWPKCGEIDVMEMIGGSNRERTVYGNMFWDNNGVVDMRGEISLPNGQFYYDEFHVYSMIWDENKIQWLVDDAIFHEVDITGADKTEFHNSFFIILNVAVGGVWPGNPNQTTEFPTKMFVDYVRVFQNS